MKGAPIIILLVEDDPAHAEIVLRNFKDFNLANRIIHVEDGQAALDYLYHKGEFSDPQKYPRPNIVLLDCACPGWTAWKSSNRSRQTRSCSVSLW